MDDARESRAPSPRPNMRFLLTAGVMLLALAGCAHQTVVLVPDANGHVGKAEVATVGGKQLLDKPDDMTRTSGRQSPPAAVATADPGYIASTFREALAIEPQPPEAFTLYFETGTIVLRPDSRDLIAAVAAAVSRRKAITVSISGHTDATGSDAINDALSLDRANAVKALLQEQGVKPELMSVTSHGSGNPAVPTPEGTPEPKNRRVVVIVQ
jgi:outer membrane protein OmpA-like peptidoglycan-associated protein